MILKKENNLILVTGPEGAGKETIIQKSGQQVDFYKIITTTTQPFYSEKSKEKSYKFISQEQFEKEVENEAFITSFKKGGNYYGVTYAEIQKAENTNLPIVWNLLPPEAFEIKRKYPNIKIVFICAPLFFIKKRLEKEGVSSSNIINSKLIEAKSDMDLASKKADFIIVNEEERSDKAAEELTKIIKENN